MRPCEHKNFCRLFRVGTTLRSVLHILAMTPELLGRVLSLSTSSLNRAPIP